MSGRGNSANLQPHLTVKQSAKLYNVSERLVYMARKVLDLRPDLAERIEAGEISVNEAYGLATQKPKPTSWDRLIRAWNSASDDDRLRLIVMLRAAERDEGTVL